MIIVDLLPEFMLKQADFDLPFDLLCVFEWLDVLKVFINQDKF
jgi:hypothetical protein